MADAILVTGGAGFIGSRLVRRLLDAGNDVTVLDSLVPAVHGADAVPPESIAGARFIHGDVRDEAAWRDGLSGVATVYHLASETGTGESMYRSKRYVDVNVGGTALLADLLASNSASLDVGRVVLASSRAVYGEGPYRCERDGVVYPGVRSEEALSAGAWEPLCPACGGQVRPVPVAAGMRTGPTSVYGMTKQSQEDLLDLVLPTLGTQLVTLRLQNVYGPGQSLRNPYTGILSIFSVRLLAGQGIRVFEDGRESRDFVYVDDVVEAFVRAGAGDTAPSTVIDVGSGRATTVREVADLLGARYGAPAGAIETTGEYRVGDIRHAVADVTAMERRLGLGDRTALDDGLRAFADWVATEDRPESTLDDALEEMASSGLLGRAARVRE